MENYWFSSDWHLSHKSIKEKLRPQFSSIEEMDDTIITNMFQNVSKGDQFYFLGDMILGRNKDSLKKVIDLKNKNKIHFHWIIGNHDKKLSKYFFEFCDSVVHIKNIKINNQKITLCHYPMISWNCSHYGAWQLFGHHHCKNHGGPVPIMGKQINVNCEFHNFKPLTFEQIKIEIDKLKNGWDYIEKKDNEND